MPRIPYIQFDEVEESVAKPWRERGLDSALSHVTGHAQGLVDPMRALNDAICGFDGRCTVDRTHRELAAVRTALLCHCRYLAAAHTLAALGHGGNTDAQVAALHAGDIESDAFDDAQKCVLKFTTEVVENVAASDATLKALQEFYTNRQIVELIILIWSRMTLCQLAEHAGVTPEDNALFDDKWADAHYEYPYRGLNGQVLGGGHGEG